MRRTSRLTWTRSRACARRLVLVSNPHRVTRWPDCATVVSGRPKPAFRIIGRGFAARDLGRRVCVMHNVSAPALRSMASALTVRHRAQAHCGACGSTVMPSLIVEVWRAGQSGDGEAPTHGPCQARKSLRHNGLGGLLATGVELRLNRCGARGYAVGQMRISAKDAEKLCGKPVSARRTTACSLALRGMWNRARTSNRMRPRTRGSESQARMHARRRAPVQDACQAPARARGSKMRTLASL